MRDFKEFFKRRSTIWTLSLCMTGIIVLGGITAVDKSRRADETQQVKESELGDYALLDEAAKDVNDTLDGPLGEEQAESDGMATVSGDGVTNADAAGEGRMTGDEDVSSVNGELTEDAADGSVEASGTVDGSLNMDSTAAASSEVISEQALLMEGVDFAAESDLLLWPAAGSILIDYSMDGSVYFPTLNQYKYNPALVIGSDVGNQVLAAAKGVVESIYIDEETGTTLVMNIGNGYKLTYGQLKELAVEEGDIIEEGAVIGYVSEPTKYYTQEGSNLYFEMTNQDTPVDPILYLE